VIMAHFSSSALHQHRWSFGFLSGLATLKSTTPIALTESLTGLGTIRHLLPAQFLQGHAEPASDLQFAEDTSSVSLFLSVSDNIMPGLAC